jgi:hypothetical protein
MNHESLMRSPAAEPSAVRRNIQWEGRMFVGAMLLTRLGLLAVLGRLVHGQEFTEDVHMLIGMARAPFEILMGDTLRYGQHPPLLPLLEALVVIPLERFLSDFYAIRLAFIVYETLAAWFFWRALVILVPEIGMRHRIEAAFVILPMGWMTSTIMAQDEVIAASLLTGVFWLITDRHFAWALFLCGLSVVAGKIFLIVPLVALILQPPRAYYCYDAAGVRETSRPYEMEQHPAMVRSYAALCASMLLWVFVLFYHVNPEYYVLVMPVVLLSSLRRKDLLPVVLLLTIPWAVNFFFGVRNAVLAEVGGGKGVFVGIYQALFPFDPGSMFQAALWLCIFVTLWMAVSMTVKAMALDCRMAGEGGS